MLGGGFMVAANQELHQAKTCGLAPRGLWPMVGNMIAVLPMSVRCWGLLIVMAVRIIPTKFVH